MSVHAEKTNQHKDAAYIHHGLGLSSFVSRGVQKGPQLIRGLKKVRNVDTHVLKAVYWGRVLGRTSGNTADVICEQG